MLTVYTIHDCTPPSMLLESYEEEYTVRKMFKKERRTRTKYKYSSATADWDCPVCKSRWHYWPRRFGTLGKPDYGWFRMSTIRLSHEIDETVTEISSLGS